MIKRRLNIVGVTILCAFVAGCGGGSDDDDNGSSGLEPIDPSTLDPVTPVDTGPVVPVDTGPVVPVDTGPVVPVDTGPVVPVDTGPVVPVDTGPVVPVDTGPVIPVNTDPDPSTSGLGLVEDLLGSTTLVWQFSNTDQLFAASTTYTQESISETDGGNQVLGGLAVLTTSETGDSDFADSGVGALVCSELLEDIGFCVLVTGENDATVNFIFPPLVNGQADGNFELCAADRDTGDCVEDLLSPALADGPMTILNTAATAAVSSLGNVERDSTYNTYATDTMLYLEQGTTFNDTSDGRMDFTETDKAMIIEAMKTVTASAKSSTLAD